MSEHRIFAMPFNKVYPHYITKAEKKGRTKEEVDLLINWLTGYKEEDIVTVLENDISFRDFFEHAPSLNPNRYLITGSVCGIKVQEVKDPLMQNIRYLDKLIDELAKNKPLDKILRKPKEV